MGNQESLPEFLRQIGDFQDESLTTPAIISPLVWITDVARGDAEYRDLVVPTSHRFAEVLPVHLQAVDTMVVMSAPLLETGDFTRRQGAQLDQFAMELNSSLVGGSICRTDEVVMLKREEYIADAAEAADLDVRLKNFTALHEMASERIDLWTKSQGMPSNIVRAEERSSYPQDLAAYEEERLKGRILGVLWPSRIQPR